MKILAIGAEAIIIKEKNLIKRRIPKGYRLKELDTVIRKRRTKTEIKLLTKALQIIPVPKIISNNEYDIELEYIVGQKLANVLDKKKNYKEICFQIGKNLAKIHDIDIIHSDLTTSNMILSNKNNLVYFIDFGLGFISNRIEDKAVDLHVLSEALEAKHPKNSKILLKEILKGYSLSKNSKEVLFHLNKVENRGRYKTQY